jgi:integrase
MASVINDPNGRKRIQFVAGDGPRRTIRLGKASMRQAESIKVKVEQLALASTGATGIVDDETIKWLGGLDDGMYGKLAAVGLVGRRESTRLGEFIDGYIKARDDVKGTTATTYAQARRHLTTFFGPDRLLRDISEGDAELWRLHLIREGLADASVRKFCGIAKQFLRMAAKQKLVPSNPFIELKSSAAGNDKRQYFVSRQDVEKVLAACPDTEWKLIFALCRYGGVRCPSEVLTLKWTDVNWERNRILIHSPKTEHHPGGESRLIPLFPELLPYLREAFEEAKPGSEFVITRYRRPNSNLRTQLERIIRKAGLKAWPRLFQNLRSSRETELCEQWPEHVVCSWIGNSKVVARRHYLQLRDEDFARAAQNAAHEEHEVQKTAQRSAAVNRIASHQNPHEDNKNDDSLVGANCCKSLQDKNLGDEGIEPSTAALRVRCSTD